MKALDEGNVDLVLPFVKVDGEDAIRAAFLRSMAARAAGPEAREVADLYFFETTVRVRRRGENAPYTGLKPAGLEVDPSSRWRRRPSNRATRGASFGCSPTSPRRRSSVAWITSWRCAPPPGASVPEVREYVEAMLGLEVWSNLVFKTLQGDSHAQSGVHED